MQNENLLNGQKKVSVVQSRKKALKFVSAVFSRDKRNCS